MRLSRDDVAPILAIVLSGSLGALVTVSMASRLFVGGRAEVRVDAPLIVPARVDVRPVPAPRVQPPRTGAIIGHVVDTNSGRPIAAAQVYIEALSLGVLTREDGSYLMLNVPPGQHVVTVQRIGYGKVSADVIAAGGGNATLDFRMSEEAIDLTNVVVTVPAAPRSPMIFLDGVRVETRNGSPSLDNIDPDIIDQISVLKGPEAAQRYGADASTGVILVTTKRNAADPN